MLASKRQEFILEQLNRQGQVNISSLSEELKVSAETIRRDISLLYTKKLLKKVHGGAVALKQNRFEDSYFTRAEENTKEKKAIGKYCARFIEDNDVIGLATGATTDWICRYLPQAKNLTVITTSFSGVSILMERKLKGEISANIIFLGGSVNIKGNYCEGSLTMELLERFSIDKAFIASTAVSENGIKMYDVFDGEFSKAMVKQSASIYYLGASDKMGHEALYKVCELDKLNYFITDDKLSIPKKLSLALSNSAVICHVVPI